jgi:formylglycine-generating enzyme required for sulfatase activity
MVRQLPFALVASAFFLTACSGGSSSSPTATTCTGLVCIETVNVADAGNPADADTGFGKVDYDYAIGKYETTVSQYVVFLNAVAAVPANSAIKDLWTPDMEDTASYVSPGLISRKGSGTDADPYVYAEIPDTSLGQSSSRRAILNISWFSAARFANWLHNGANKTSSTETGAYTLNGATSGVFTKNADAKWWIPSENEWYKAAYYDPTKSGTNKYWKYPTRSDSLPVAEPFPGGANSANYDSPDSLEGHRVTPVGAYAASVSYYGTYDQAGLMWEWNDAVYTDYEDKPLTRGMRGGSWSLGMINVSKFGPRDYEPVYDDDDSGFRLATTRK